MKNVYGKDIKNNTRLTRHYQDYELEEANKDWKQNTVEDYCPKRDVSYDDCLNKLGQLEDIEEELGIDLITLFKALKNGCYVKPWKSIKFSSLQLHHHQTYILFDINDNDYSLEDYGKTWALTKEELL